MDNTVRSEDVGENDTSGVDEELAVDVCDVEVGSGHRLEGGICGEQRGVSDSAVDDVVLKQGSSLCAGEGRKNGADLREGGVDRGEDGDVSGSVHWCGEVGCAECSGKGTEVVACGES